VLLQQELMSGVIVQSKLTPESPAKPGVQWSSMLATSSATAANSGAQTIGSSTTSARRSGHRAEAKDAKTGFASQTSVEMKRSQHRKFCAAVS
jgi:hypothetical protein